jgi:tetratricopeptide (TPR) repeat protein
LCEIVYGRARFLILYVCAGVLGNVASYEASPALGVGASGAIFGLFGVALVFSLKYRRELPGQMGDRLLRSLVPVLLLNLALTFSFSMIDKYAHLGGLIGGALLACLTESRTASAARHAREWLPVPAALASVVGLLLYGVWGLATVLPTAKQHLQATLAVLRQDADTAIRILERVVAQHPDDLQARAQLMDLLLVEHRQQEATGQFLEVYRRLLSRGPADPEIANDVAYTYANGGGDRLQEAEQLAQQAVKAEPNNGAILDTLAWIYYKEGKLKEAYVTQQQAVGLTPGEPGSRYHMGVIEEAMGHVPAAREEYGMALRLDANQPEAKQALARLNGKPGRPPE